MSGVHASCIPPMCSRKTWLNGEAVREFPTMPVGAPQTEAQWRRRVWQWEQCRIAAWAQAFDPEVGDLWVYEADAFRHTLKHRATA